MKKFFLIVAMLFIAAGCSNNSVTGSNPSNPANTCGADARNWLDANNWTKPPAQITGMTELNRSYKFNSDTANKSCYVLVESITENVLPSEISLYINYDFWDIYRKDDKGQTMKLGSLTDILHQKNTPNVFTCSVLSHQCFSIGEFLRLVEPYLGKQAMMNLGR